MSDPRIGLLAFQGDYEAHGKALARTDIASITIVEVRCLSDLEGVDALIIPGGESTVMGMLLERFGMFKALKTRIEDGLPVLATCAGLILLAKNIEGSNQARLGVLDVTVLRNAYGRQIDSFHAPVQTSIPQTGTIDGVFIRAPKITALGEGVKVIATYRNEPVMVRQGSIVAATFHPELLPDASLHRWFIQSFLLKTPQE
ncbi:MAG: pyridoxal 5'-phosphate synthase glutaminase subunit PdxT [Rectinema sp.]